jgi:hypothetical protein
MGTRRPGNRDDVKPKREEIPRVLALRIKLALRYLALGFGSSNTLGEAALFASGGVFVHDAFGGGTINLAHSSTKGAFAGQNFFRFSFNTRLSDLVPQLALYALAQPFFR